MLYTNMNMIAMNYKRFLIKSILNCSEFNEEFCIFTQSSCFTVFRLLIEGFESNLGLQPCKLAHIKILVSLNSL